LIAHRLSSIQNADRIIAMSNGRIAEQGTYGELMVRASIQHRDGPLTHVSKAMDGVFSALVRHQTPATRAPHEEAKPYDPPLESSNTSAQHLALKNSVSRPISVMSVAKTAVDESMERGLLAQETAPSGIASRFIRLLWAYKFWIIVGCCGGICACV
jgi:ABC-type multidrug transport system ATPase subunit